MIISSRLHYQGVEHLVLPQFVEMNSRLCFVLLLLVAVSAKSKSEPEGQVLYTLHND